MFPRLGNLGTGPFGEDADTFGDTLAEVIQDEPQTRGLPFKIETIQELRTLLAGSDEEIDRVTRALIRIDPTADVEEPPNWGRFPSLRAFWSAVLHVFENDPEVQAGREIDPNA
ncbi:hypothetical protein K2X14_13760 [Acetobacter sp. TBRC 12305]|uniref:CdiI immunity protein domain-containing protein n=1 Tax=Acetobacter garciniae TaxID=2817435 RepID=A0A939KQW3_9PROT|nr:hypothetical protein [Acetobacter garciniae]MBO1326004.1 hypothetical protein [Acetobacter garciniae]MBX0345904.1 hypothetical protein [Acetobacter garciniae]